MKKKIAAIIVCGALAASLVSCQKKEDNPDVSAAGSSEQETSGKSENGMPEESDSMNHVMLALAMAGEETGKEYAVWDGTYFWTACTYLISEDGAMSAGAEEKDGTLVLTEDDVREAANALFAAYDGNRKALPDIPEDFTAVAYDSETEQYTFEKKDAKDWEVVVNSCGDHEDGTYEIQASVVSGTKQEPVADYSVGMQDTSYEGTGKPLYHYMITTFDQTKSYEKGSGDTGSNDESDKTDTAGGQEQTGTDNNSGTGADNNDNTNSQQKPSNTGKKISQEEALALAENGIGKDGATDPETGNIYSFGFEGMTKIDGVEYYNFRLSWLVVDESGNADHSSYLTNIFVSADGSSVKQGSRGTDGSWEFNA